VSFQRISAVTSQAGIMFLLSGPVVIFSDMTSRIMASQRWAQIVGFELCARPQGIKWAFKIKTILKFALDLPKIQT
jgi:hypothetical protein